MRVLWFGILVLLWAVGWGVVGCEPTPPTQEKAANESPSGQESTPTDANTPGDTNSSTEKSTTERPSPDVSTGEPAPDKARPCEVLDPAPPGVPRPNYAQFQPKIGSHCDGTNHQDIKDVQKVIFVGDSITKGTPPTPVELYYRNQLSELLKAKFGDIEIKDCSAWGARTDDFLLEPNKQLKTCLPDDVESKRTLIITTMGGNDMQSIAKNALDGEPLDKTNQRVDNAIKLLEDALKWAKDEKRFPNGSYVVFGNVYEYTDGTGDLPSCQVAKVSGLDKVWEDGPKVFLRFNESMMKLAVETKTDMVFMLERFCGHGFHSDDTKSSCYLGPDTPRWFDLTCIHPSPEGHTALAKMFMNVINE